MANRRLADIYKDNEEFSTYFQFEAFNATVLLEQTNPDEEVVNFASRTINELQYRLQLNEKAVNDCREECLYKSSQIRPVPL